VGSTALLKPVIIDELEDNGDFGGTIAPSAIKYTANSPQWYI
jgi:hypothetical protein